MSSSSMLDAACIVWALLLVSQAFGFADLRYSTTMKAVLSNKSFEEVDDGSLGDTSSRAVYRAGGDSDGPGLAVESSDSIDCILNVTSSSTNHFRHLVYYDDLNYVYLTLRFSKNVSFDHARDRYIVGKFTWVWTYYGKHGALAFLGWPIEFGIWSMGLLNTKAFGPMKIDIVALGGKDCQHLQIGNQSTDFAISNALASLTKALMELDKERYGPSLWCYKRRIYIKSRFLYTLCLHVVCPFEALAYSCCSYFFNQARGHREVRCNGEQSELDQLWWTGPIVFAVILLAFSPVFIIWLAWKLSRSTRNIGPGGIKVFQMSQTGGESNSANHATGFVYYDGSYPVTLFSTILGPCIEVTVNRRTLFSRIIRGLLPLLSLSVIGLQVALDTYYLHGFMIESLKKGVPQGFRSMMAGYRMSRTNFLSYLGGPFVACGIYVIITMAFLTIPRSVEDVLQAGLSNPEKPITELSPLHLNFQVLTKFGSVPIRSRQGYHRVYSYCISQFLLIINYKFWRFSVTLQVNRWRRCAPGGILARLFVGPYIALCLMELFLCLILYGIPLISFMVIVIRGYRLYICGNANRRVLIRRIAHNVFALILIAMVTFFIFMFCTIFLDAFLFMTRVVIFTYTGVVVYPKVSYGYLIFALTSVYYLWDSTQTYNRRYLWLLKMTIAASKSVQSADESPLTSKFDGQKGVRRDVFEDVIETHFPRRKEVLKSLIKIGLLLTILYMPLRLLVETHQLKELHIFMHVGTAFFICACPQIAKTMCPERKNAITRRKWLKEICKTIQNRAAVIADDSSDFSDLD